MPNLTIAHQTMPTTMYHPTRDLQPSAHVPILALVLAVAAHQRAGRPDPGVQMLLEGWADLATELLQQLTTAPEALYARRIAQRAIRISQGYDAAAKDKGYQVLVEYLQGPRGVDRDLTDEECVALNNGLVHAFAGYATYLDHVAGALPTGGGR